MAAPFGPRLAGKVALVTGAASAVGAAAARRLALEGANVVLHVRPGVPADQPKVTASARHIEGSGRRTAVIQSDERTEEGLCALVQGTQRLGDAIHVVVHIASLSQRTRLPQNAAVPPAGDVHGHLAEENAACVRSWVEEARAFHRLVHACIPLMPAESAVVSVRGERDGRERTAGLTSALEGEGWEAIVRSLARDVAPQGIRVNTVVATDGPGRSAERDARVRLSASGLLPGCGGPADVARAVAFLASAEGAGYMTGGSLGIRAAIHDE